jgi:hypothetical protein
VSDGNTLYTINITIITITTVTIIINTGKGS